MKLPIITPDVTKFTKITNIILGVLVAAMIVSASTWDFEKGNNYIGGALAIAVVVLGLLKMVRSFVIKDFKKIGFLILGNENITVIKHGRKEIYNLNQIESIRAHFYGYDGESYPVSLIGAMNARQKSGDKNKFNFVVDGISKEYEFYIKKNGERIQFFKYLNHYEKQGVGMKFTNEFGSDKMYKRV